MTDAVILLAAAALMLLGILLLWDFTIGALKDWWRDN